MPALDYCGKVEGVDVPIPHFGCLLNKADFTEVQQKLIAAEIKFLIKPQKRYQGQGGEQMTMFVFDYSNNPIEFKSFTDEKEIFENE